MKENYFVEVRKLISWGLEWIDWVLQCICWSNNNAGCSFSKNHVAEQKFIKEIFPRVSGTWRGFDDSIAYPGLWAEEIFPYSASDLV